MANGARGSRAREDHRAMIRITLRGDPGHRTGTLQIRDQAHELATWYRGGDAGHVNATTSDGVQVTLALDKGNGGITIGSRCHHIRNARWDGLTMTGDAVGVTDAEMEAMFPGCGWDSPSINA